MFLRQIFNQVNARSLTDDWNVYGLGGSSTLFIIILTIEAGLQAILVEFGGPFTKTTGLTPTHWAISIGMAAFTLPLGVVMRLIPVPPKLSDYASFYEEEFAVCMMMSGHSFLSSCLCLDYMPPLSTVAGTHGHTPLSPARRRGRRACLLGGPPDGCRTDSCSAIHWLRGWRRHGDGPFNNTCHCRGASPSTTRTGKPVSPLFTPPLDQDGVSDVARSGCSDCSGTRVRGARLVEGAGTSATCRVSLFLCPPPVLTRPLQTPPCMYCFRKLA